MQRTLEKLILKDENYFFDGDLTIKGKCEVRNGIIRVSGHLFLQGIEEEGLAPNTSCSVIRGNIIANSLKSLQRRLYCIGNINIAEDLDVCHIDCKGDIKVNGSCSTYNVTCRNYLISGNNNSDDVTATEDICILGYNYSGDLRAREIFIGDFTKFSPYSENTVIAKKFECKGPIRNCKGMLIG